MDKKHWYDGWIYDKLIAPNQDDLFAKIRSLIDTGSSVIDVGCGTGRLAMTLSDRCESIIGIDLSEKNIRRAVFNLNKDHRNNITFLHTGVPEIRKDLKIHFDYAVFSYVLHEINEDERVALLQETACIADKIILADFHNHTGGFVKIIREIIEFTAGREHFLNHRSFLLNGGISFLAKKAELQIIHEEMFHSHIHLVILIKN